MTALKPFSQALELKVPPLALGAICVLSMLSCAWGMPLFTIEFPGSGIAAVLLSGSGGMIALAAIAAFRRHGTTVNPLTPEASRTVVSGGVYRFSRNPMYLGLLLALLGLAVWLGNLVALVFPPIFALYMNRFQILPEERAMASRFGAAYGRYRRSVRRWI